MTIDASLRNGTIIPGSDGTVIPDSQPLLAANPQLIMEPGVVRTSFKFEDGNGLTDAFGNVYVGYGGAGGSSSSVVHVPSEQVVEDDVPGIQDLDFLQFDIASELYVPRSYIESQLMKFDSITTPPLDGELAVYDVTNGIWIPQKSNDAFVGIIEAPTNRLYNLAKDGLDYDIEIVSWSFLFETGPGSVTFPAVSSVILAGTPITMTVTATTGSSIFLNFQLDYKRRLVP